ncbi:MAG: hypothetical protein C0451_11655 [Comamonadaceae bacterium]|nr:hypothetical protein [Comamonadaceae bacterium]
MGPEPGRLQQHDQTGREFGEVEHRLRLQQAVEATAPEAPRGRVTEGVGADRLQQAAQTQVGGGQQPDKTGTGRSSEGHGTHR